MGKLRRTWHGLVGALVFAGAVVGSLAGVDWVRVWFYQLAWWGYILMVDAAIQARAGNSLLVDRRSSFWLGWELVNLRLGNWYYVGVPRELVLRWVGAFVAYATVLPGVLSTYELLGVWGFSWGRGLRWRPRSEAWRPWFFAVGIVMFTLSLIWPRLFFPLVWGALVFLLEPINHRLGAPSLMRTWQEEGDLSPFVRLLLAGLICGVFWESWNWLAGARWVYTIPYLSRPRIFAMPLAGYGGFPPFAVECWVFMATVSLLRGGRGWEAHDHHRVTRRPLPRWLAWGLLAGALAFDLWMLGMIDRYLVRGWV